MLSRKRLTSEHDKGRIRGVNDRSAATARQPIKVRRNAGNAATRCLTGTARRLPGRKPTLESHQDTAGEQAEHGSPLVLRISSQQERTQDPDHVIVRLHSRTPTKHQESGRQQCLSVCASEQD